MSCSFFANLLILKESKFLVILEITLGCMQIFLDWEILAQNHKRSEKSHIDQH